MMRIDGYGGNSFNGGADEYGCRLLKRRLPRLRSSVNRRNRLNQPGVRLSSEIPHRTFSAVVFPQNLESSMTTLGLNFEEYLDHFFEEIVGMFAPGNGEQLLEVLHEDGTTQLYGFADVVEVEYPESNIPPHIMVTLEATDPILRTVATKSASPNEGNFYALPVITITAGSSTCSWNRYRISDPTGQGLGGHPVKLPVSLGANDWVFDRGRAVPFSADGWIRADVPANGTAWVDVFQGTGISNPAYDKLDLGNMDPAASDNSSWTFSSLDIVAQPNAGGVMLAGKTGQVFSEVSFGVDPDEPELTLGLHPSQKYPNKHDCLVVSAGVEMSQIDGITATLTVEPNETDTVEGETVVTEEYTSPRMFIKTAGNTGGEVAVQQVTAASQAGSTSSTPETATLTFPQALTGNWVAIGLEPLEANANGLMLIEGTPVITLADTVSVTSIASGTAQVVSDSYVECTENGDRITLTKAFFTDDLEIDCLNQTVIQASGPLYYQRVKWSNPDNWLRLPVGAFTMAGLTHTLEYEERWAL